MTESETPASPVRSVPTLTSEAARAVLGAFVAGAAAYGKPFSVTVVDASGIQVAALRMDGSGAQAIQVSADKAYTAAGFRFPTVNWVERGLAQGVAGGAILAAAIDRLVPLGGGVPVVVDGVVVGAVGISGGTAAEDAELAATAIAAVFGG